MIQYPFKILSEAYKAMADETRLCILGLLLRHTELCVCDFMHVLEISQSKASRHLSHLRLAGFITDRREGVWIYYRIAETVSGNHQAILTAIRSQLNDSWFDRMEARLAEWRNGNRCQSKANEAIKE